MLITVTVDVDPAFTTVLPDDVTVTETVAVEPGSVTVEVHVTVEMSPPPSPPEHTCPSTKINSNQHNCIGRKERYGGIHLSPYFKSPFQYSFPMHHVRKWEIKIASTKI